MRSFFIFLRYELLMHIKSWRLWLCLVVLVAGTSPWRTLLSVRTNYQAGDAIAYSFFQQVASAAWILFFPMLILIAVDTVARVRSTGVWPLVFVRSFSTLWFILACWVAVVLLASLLAGAALLVRFLSVRFLLGLEVYAAPLAWLFVLTAVPAAMATVALVIWVRTVFKHNFSAYLVSGALAFGLFVATRAYDLPLLGWNVGLLQPLIQDYTPAIGRDLDWARYGSAFLNTLLLSLVVLALSCYHMRRQEPQRLVLGRYGRRWTDMPTFLQFFADLRIDRRVGAGAHLFLAGAVVLAGVVAVRSTLLGQARADRLQRWATELRKDLREQAPVVPGLLIRRYQGDLRVDRPGWVSGDLRMVVENTTQTAIAQFALTIPHGVEVEQLEGSDGRPLRARRWGTILVADLGASLAPGATTTIRLAYGGRPRALQVGNRVPFSDRYEVEEKSLEEIGISLGRRYLCIGSWLLPRSAALIRVRDGVAPVDTPALFTVDLRVSAPRGLELVSPDGFVEPLEDQGAGRRVRFGIDWPCSEFTLLGGPYVRVERQYGPTRLWVYCFPSDRDVVEFLVDEYAETIERWGKVLGPSRRSAYALIETPLYSRANGTFPLAVLHSQELRRLRRYLPLFKQREPAGIQAVAQYQRAIAMALATTMVRESFHPSAAIAPLRDGLFWYLYRTVRLSAVGPLARRSALLFAPLGEGGRGGFGDPTREVNFATPLIERMADPKFQGFDSTHIWRMLHYLLEDDRFAEFVRTLAAEYGDRQVSLTDLQTVAERVHGEPLDWFFREWFFGKGLPKYEILEGRATMVENRRTRSIDYDVRIVVANRGSGRMPVPVVLLTERDRITRKVWLDSGTTETLAIRVVDRPERVTVDPEGWITQQAFWDSESRSRGPAQRKVRVVE